MDNERTAEWMRQGIWKYVTFAVCESCFPSWDALARKRNAQAYQEQLRETADEARWKRAHRETREADERRRRKRSREGRAKQTAHDDYGTRWDTLLTPDETPGHPPAIRDIPWPCHAVYSTSDDRHLSLEDLAIDSISEFLICSAKASTESTQKVRAIRKTLHRFHPDNFVADRFWLVHFKSRSPGYFKTNSTAISRRTVVTGRGI